MFAFIKTFAGGLRLHRPPRAAGANPSQGTNSATLPPCGRLWRRRRSESSVSGAGDGGPGALQELVAERQPAGAGPGGGARQRRSRGLATGNSQWECESGGACAPPAGEPARSGGVCALGLTRAGKGCQRREFLWAWSPSLRRGRARD